MKSGDSKNRIYSEKLWKSLLLGKQKKDILFGKCKEKSLIINDNFCVLVFLFLFFMDGIKFYRNANTNVVFACA